MSECTYTVRELEWQSETVLKIVIFKFNPRTSEDDSEYAHVPNRIIHLIIENDEITWKTRFGGEFEDTFIIEKQKIMQAIDVYLHNTINNLECAKQKFEALIEKGHFKD